MPSLLYHILFSLFTIYVLIESISYAIFEIREQNNKFGATCVITFTIFCILLGNIIIWQN